MKTILTTAVAVAGLLAGSACSVSTELLTGDDADSTQTSTGATGDADAISGTDPGPETTAIAAPERADETTSSTAPATDDVDSTPDSLATPDEGTSERSPAETAAFVVLEDFDFDETWRSDPPTPSTVDYDEVEGCGFVNGLLRDDGNVFSLESRAFTRGDDLSIEHEVRVYDGAITPTDLVLVWAEQRTIDCVVTAATGEAQKQLDAGELGTVEQVDIELQVYEDHIGEPRITNLEITNTLTDADGSRLVVIVDRYVLQVGNVISFVDVVSPDTPWEGTPDVLDLVIGRMNQVT